MVEERDSRTGLSVLNQPAGHLEQGETLIDAVEREVLEETRWAVTTTGYLGVARYESPNGSTYLRHGFVCRPEKEMPERSLDAGIIAVHWMTQDQLTHSTIRLRSPLVLRAVDLFLSGAVAPLSFVSDG
jgi:ADP-ribose pyrophosphatase YjhB (NUDIX family)